MQSILPPFAVVNSVRSELGAAKSVRSELGAAKSVRSELGAVNGSTKDPTFVVISNLKANSTQQPYGRTNRQSR